MARQQKEKRDTVTPFDRSRRRRTGWRLSQHEDRSWRADRRTRDPRVFLRGAILVGCLGLLTLPVIADGLSAVVPRYEENGCRILSVVDGDTVRIYCPARGFESARLMGFDTPEIFSPQCTSERVAGLKAKWFLRWKLLRARDITIVRNGTDRYDRALIFVSVDQHPISQIMVEHGHARPYRGGARDPWCGSSAA